MVALLEDTWQPIFPENTEKLHAYKPGPERCCSICGVHQSKHDAPYAHLVPKGKAENLRFRKKILKMGRNPKTARLLWEMCARDVLFWINVFVFTFDPRKIKEGKKSRTTFCTWPFQDELILLVKRAIEKGYDLPIKKSRDMGASWICLLVILHFWLFRGMLSFLLVSRVQDLVDNPDEPDSLFWKLDFIIRYLPSWMRPPIVQGKHRKMLLLKNPLNGSVISGSSTTGDVGRGGRKTCMLFDEFAAVEDGFAMCAASNFATECRIFNSTSKGSGTAFANRYEADEHRIWVPWTLHPEHAEGLYLDAMGRPRSPWYDEKVKKAAHPREAQQELDGDDITSGFQYFDNDVLTEIKKRDGRAPFTRGELQYDHASGEPTDFVENPNGRLLLWMYPDRDGNLPRDRDYVVAADISQGTGASNSVLTVGDSRFRCKVAEIATPNVRPEEFAVLAVALAKWCKGRLSDDGAMMVWEANGPGRPFGDKVIEMGYRRIWYRLKEKDIRKQITSIPGWFSTKDNKRTLLGDYRKAITGAEFTERSIDCLEECRQYIFTPQQDIVHVASLTNLDPSGARESHSDRVISSALLWMGMKDQEYVPEPKEELPIECPGRRRLEWEAQRRRKDDW